MWQTTWQSLKTIFLLNYVPVEKGNKTVNTWDSPECYTIVNHCGDGKYDANIGKLIKPVVNALVFWPIPESLDMERGGDQENREWLPSAPPSLSLLPVAWPPLNWRKGLASFTFECGNEEKRALASAEGGATGLDWCLAAGTTISSVSFSLTRDPRLGQVFRKVGLPLIKYATRLPKEVLQRGPSSLLFVFQQSVEDMAKSHQSLEKNNTAYNPMQAILFCIFKPIINP